MLNATAIEKSFPGPPRLRVLSGLDLSVGARETVAVVGPSGSGKSTLLNILGTLDLPDAGRLTLSGDDLLSLNDEATARVRARRIGFVFQLHHLLPQCTVLENSLLPVMAAYGRATADAIQRAHELLSQVGLSERRDAFPGHLSVGQRQRVAVVRALINSPALILADEPTGALDRRRADELVELLLDLTRSEGSALVVATHSMSIARRMDHVLTLEDGQLQPAPLPDPAEEPT